MNIHGFFTSNFEDLVMMEGVKYINNKNGKLFWAFYAEQNILYFGWITLCFGSQTPCFITCQHVSEVAHYIPK